MISRRKSILYFQTVACSCVVPGERALALASNIPIAVVAGSDQRMPTISGNWIAWQDDCARRQLNAVRAESRTTGTEFWVSPDPSVPVAIYSNPRLSGDTVLFQGNPESKGTLFYDNLADANPFQKVYNQSIHQYVGDVHDNLIVWQESAVSPLVGGDLYGSYLGSNTKFPISTTGNVYINPVTDGRFVVWREFVTPSQLSLFAKDVQNGATSLLSSTGPEAEIDAGVVVFPVSGGIGVRNLLTNQSSTIPTPTPFSVAISGDLVVYSIKTAGKTDYDLWGVHLQDGHQFLISDAPGNQIWADVDGSFVVWTDSRNGDNDIYGTWVPEPGTISLVALALFFGLIIRLRSI